jgi:hypothetical protein
MNRKSQAELLSVILSLFVIGSSALLITNSTNDSYITGSAILANNVVEKTFEIEVWANVSFDFEIERNSVGVFLFLDNGTALSDKVLDFYLNGSLVSSEITDSEGYVKSNFNPNKINPGIYFLEVEFQGDSFLYLNSLLVGKQVEIFESDEVNETSVSLEGLICKEFSDDILFSSGYTHDENGSTNYETWVIQTSCDEAGGEDCSLHNVNTKSRILYVSPYDDEATGEGYVQISRLNDSDCYSPEKENYSEYIVRDIIEEEGGKWERYCEKNKTSSSKCDVENSYNRQEESMCYGIKTHASQYSIVDVVEISYTWCWGDEHE